MKCSAKPNDVLLLGPVGGVEERRGLGPRAQHASSTDFARLFERSERSERSEFCARPQTPSTAEQSALGRPPPSGPPFFGDFLSGKRKFAQRGFAHFAQRSYANTKVTALSGAYPDAASRSEQPPRKSRTRLRYLSPNGEQCANQASTSSARTDGDTRNGWRCARQASTGSARTDEVVARESSFDKLSPNGMSSTKRKSA